MVAVTLTNTNQLAQDQANAMEAKLNGQVDHELEKLKANYQAWANTFLAAEETRRVEEENWRKFYAKVYEEDNAWWKDVAFFVLNGIQLWALTEQYNQQKEIADRTYELANRQSAIAEELYAFYKSNYQPHETALGEQINNYFANPYRPQYDITAGRFATNARIAMLWKRRDALRCASQYCTGATSATLKDLALEEATLVSNAMNSAVKYEKLRKFRMDDLWTKIRYEFMAAGRNTSSQGMQGIDAAVTAFSSFGADPGAALGQLLSTISYTVSGIIPKPQEATGGRRYGSSNPFVYNTYAPAEPTTKAG